MRAAIFGAPRHDIKGNIALYKPTAQVSSYQTSYSSNAVDGGRQTNYQDCAHTDTARDAWWRVDLGRVEDVTEVHILSRNGHASDMYGAEIRVGDSTDNGGANNHLCADNIRLSANQEKTFSCRPTASGRYVYIRNPGNSKVAVVCEVEVYSLPNLAVNQPATQASVFQGSQASRAVDGNKNRDWDLGSCMHTQVQNDPWWRVDLGASLSVAEVFIVNRFCTSRYPCANHLNAFEIRIGDDTSTNTSCGGTLSLTNGETKSFYCDPPIVGRYVSVVIPGTSKVLNMCELEVYSVRQVSSGVTACRMNSVRVSDSSIIYDQRFSASSSLSSSPASNGRLNGASAWIPSSSNNINDYLQIDLGSVYVVCAVATQGNPNADDWTKTYKIETSLDNVNWQWYQENSITKSFTGNSQKNEIVKNDLYNPVAVKFIRFYPVTNHSRKALRVEVYGSKQGCTSSVGNEEGVASQPFSVTASSQLGSHTPENSSLYGSSSWCWNGDASSPQYLQFDFRKVVTVRGIATQGDAVHNKWVTKYAVSYGYDEQSWLDYAGGQHLTGNSDKSSVVVHWFSSPFAAQFVRILPKNYTTAQCMRVDLFGCRDFQVAFLYVNVSIATLPAAHGASVSLNCITGSSQQWPHALVYEWRKDGVKLPVESSSSLTIAYSNASDINNKYHCGSLSSSSRDVQCTAVYQCSVTGVGLPEVNKRGNSTVTVLLKKPGQIIGVSKSEVTARTALVTWTSYSPGEDEASTINITLRYQNSTPPYHLVILPGSSSSQELTNLKPFSKYNVTVMASSVLGDGLWSSAVTFTTYTALPEITIQVDNTTAVTSQSIYVEWKKPNIEKLNGLFAQYTIAYRKSGGAEMLANVTNIDTTFHTVPNLKKWTLYLIKVRVENHDHAGPWSIDHNTTTQQDAPSKPTNLRFTISAPSKNTRPRMKVTWDAPSEENGIISKYTLTYSYNYYFNGVTNSTKVSTNGQTFEYTFDVLGGIEYNVSIYAKTIKPGPKEEQVESVPVYPPGIAIQVDNTTGVASQSIHVEWTKPNIEKLNGPFSQYTIAYRESGGAEMLANVTNIDTTFHTIPNLKKWTLYFIRVRVENRDHAGPWSVEHNATTQQDAPSKPRDLQLSSSKPSKNTRPRMKVTWGAPAEQNGIITKYILTYSYNFSGVTNSTKVSTNGQTFEYTFDVLGGIQYSVSVYAETIKPGPKEEQVELVLVYKPSTAPSDIVLQLLNETTYNISWDRLTREESNGEVLAYEVKYRRMKQAGASSLSAPRYQNTTDTVVTLQGLTLCSSYNAHVRAYTSAGAGPFSHAIKITTTVTLPGPPRDVEVGTPSERSITISWKKPFRYGDKVQMYTVNYEGTKSYYPEFKHTNSVQTVTLKQEITDLYPGTNYTFVVVASTPCGKGNDSTMETRRTVIASPLPPNNTDRPQEIKTEGLLVYVTIWAASQDNGPISYYQIVVHQVQDWTDTVSDWNDFGPDVYISAQIPAADVKTEMIFALGDGEDKGGYINKELSRGQKYKIYSRALTKKSSKKRSTDESFLIGPAQLLAQVEVEAAKTEEVKGESSTTAVVASVVSVLLVIIVGAVAGVIFWRRRRGSIDRSSKGSESHPMTDFSVNDAYDTIRPDNVSQPQKPRGAEQGEPVGATAEPIYGNAEVTETEDKPKPIPVSQFSEYVTQMRREKNAGFAKQYKLLASGQQFPWENAKKPVNKNKNRYANIIPYDHSRVILPLVDGAENSDYVLFVNMVLLLNLPIFLQTKCHQYWPDKAETYLDITVTNHKTETFADYAIRTFILQKKGTQERRQVQQFHFLVWPDKGVPRHATAVLALRRKVRTSHNSNNKNPLVVHCSAGVGRTGAFIVIDAMLESIEKKKVADVFNYVKLLRVNRISMVQTEEQYAFIHMALLESVICGNTEIPAQDLRIALKKLVAVNPKTNMTGLAREYQRLDLITADDVTDIKDSVGRQKENASKNRFPDIVPLNGSRVILQDANSDYINASYVDTFRERNSFIMTQAPLENTIEDFWKMIWDYNIGTIVMLNEQKEGDQVYPMYWATEGSATFGEFTVETASHEIFQDFSQREFSVAKKEVGLVDPQTVRQVHHYQITDWPDKGIPKNAHCILDMISMVEQSQRKTSNAPLVVQCSDGVGRSGTFCAILSVIERLKSEQVIDVCQSVKVIRVNRPKAVNCKAQYVFCYNLVQSYLDSFNEYANFN
ncbi:PREDICTED: receptor-type tyrosine-protein phosphatase delta-like [Acropora digitifera]|uniref:receptor-type tyrosine-protein phosphatase delta-like n=1 Tax=Acropora digitifera TaxID=70779 RepID=UPI00077B00C6|nr:PREDICTED: receptor-type tyrosine-protein phosphatase delta-like [Acropora digitifera]